LSAIFEAQWLQVNKGGKVVLRELMSAGIPYMDVDWIAGVYAPPQVQRSGAMQKALALSEELINEVRSADRILIGTPMYNYSVPAVLKSWIDYIVRPGFTFALAPGWPGLLHDRPVDVLVAARDEYDPERLDRLDALTPVIQRAFAFMGISDVRSLVAGGSLGVNRGDVALADHLAKFEAAVTQAARN
jgi:FMN-dependent NADH-azoreductase